MEILYVFFLENLLLESLVTEKDSVHVVFVNKVGKSSIWWTNCVKLFIIPEDKDWQTLNKYMYPVRLHIEVFCLQWSTNFRFDRQLSPHTPGIPDTSLRAESDRNP